MAALLHVAAGVALALAAWLLPRRIAKARLRSPVVLLVDAAPMAFGAGLLGLAVGRPLFAGTVVLALGAAFALTDYTMRRTLREPIVFSEAVELPQVFTHPHLYLPFAGPRLVVAGAGVATLLVGALLVFEPPLWTPHPWVAFAALGLIALGGRLFSRQPLLAVAAGLLRRLAPTGEPFADAAGLGPFAMLLAHTVIARAERAARQRALAVPPMVARRGTGGMPIVIVQCESFFDARRLGPRIPPVLLAGFDRCCRSAAMYGRLEVAGWGANTMRAEFAVLTGIADSELGYDRFNPYYALARVPIESQVWRLRRAGYRTICLHPFDRRFFRRDLVMPALGFEEFRGRETIGGTRRPPYCPDPELAERILCVLDEAGPNSFIFAITMGNHGPWPAGGAPIAPSLTALFDPAGIPERADLLCYLDGLRRSDEMLQVLMAGLERRGMAAVLAFYGDHLPSLPQAFGHLGFAEGSSDYVIWPGGGASLRHDLAAHELGKVVVDAALAIEGPLRLHGASGAPATTESANLV
jgi:hypothetical protein